MALEIFYNCFILTDPSTREIVLYCKGADTSILSNLKVPHPSGKRLRTQLKSLPGIDASLLINILLETMNFISFQM